jgi:hypothetical protein
VEELGDPFIGPRGSYNFAPDPAMHKYLSQFEAKGERENDRMLRAEAIRKAALRKQAVRLERDSVPLNRWHSYAAEPRLLEREWCIDKELEAELAEIDREICRRDNEALMAPLWPHNY